MAKINITNTVQKIKERWEINLIWGYSHAKEQEESNVGIFPRRKWHKKRYIINR